MSTLESLEIQAAAEVQTAAGTREWIRARYLGWLALLLVPLAVLVAGLDGALLGAAWEEEGDGFA